MNRKPHFSPFFFITVLLLMPFLVVTGAPHSLKTRILPLVDTAVPSVSTYSKMEIGSKTITSSSFLNEAQNVEFVGRIGGLKYIVVTQGNYAYIDEGESLTILDITNLTTPSTMSRTPLPGRMQGMTIAGDFAYIGGDWEGLLIIDVSNPSSPSEAVLYDIPYEIPNVAVAGSYAYIATRYDGLHIVDISSPAAPTRVSSIDFSGSEIDVAVAGDYAYVIGVGPGSNRLHIIDIANPTAPTRVSFKDIYQTVITVSDGYAYITGTSTLKIIDVSDSTAPITVASVNLQEEGRDIAVAGDYAYITVGSYPGAPILQILDISKPLTPIMLGSYELSPQSDLGFEVHGVAVKDNHAYVANGDSLHIVEVTNPAIPLEAGFYNTMPSVRHLSVDGNYAYTVRENFRRNSTLYAIAVDNPRLPVLVSHLNIPQVVDENLGVSDLVVAENYAYFTVNYDGLYIIDVADPANPTERSYFEKHGENMRLVVVGNYAYVLSRVIANTDYSKLSIIDISDPDAPIETGSFVTETPSSAIAVAGDYAYVPVWSGLHIIDVSDPTAPTEKGFFEASLSLWPIAVNGEYVYVADENGWLRIIDVTDPTAPIEIGFLEFSGSMNSLDVVEDYVYVTNSEEKLIVIDVSDPTNPIQVGSYDTPGSTTYMEVSEDFVYGGYGLEGLLILKYVNPAEMGQIVVDKVTNPSESSHSFHFVLTGDPENIHQNFWLTDAAEPWDSRLLMPGTYSITETISPSWELSAATCDNGSEPTNIQLGSGDTVICTFTNTYIQGRIIVDKVTNPESDPQPFLFTLAGGPDNLEQDFTLSDATEPWDSGLLMPGTYSITETISPSWELSAATCDNGSEPTNIQLGSGNTVICTFNNINIQSQIIVDKVTNPENDPQPFLFTLTGGPDNLEQDFTLNDAAEPWDSGLLIPGTYSLTEILQPGWKLSMATCDNGDEPSSIELGIQETVTCTFINRKYMIFLPLIMNRP